MNKLFALAASIVIGLTATNAYAKTSAAQAEWMANQCQAYYHKNNNTVHKYGSYKSYERVKSYGEYIDKTIRINWSWIAPWGETIWYQGRCDFNELTWKVSTYYMISKK